MPVAPGQSGTDHALRACVHQGVRGGGDGASGGAYVVDEQKAAAFYSFRMRRGIRVPHVLRPFGRTGNGGLRPVMTDFPEGRFRFCVPDFCGFLR